MADGGRLRHNSTTDATARLVDSLKGRPDPYSSGRWYDGRIEPRHLPAAAELAGSCEPARSSTSHPSTSTPQPGQRQYGDVVFSDPSQTPPGRLFRGLVGVAPRGRHGQSDPVVWRSKGLAEPVVPSSPAGPCRAPATPFGLRTTGVASRSSPLPRAYGAPTSPPPFSCTDAGHRRARRAARGASSSRCPLPLTDPRTRADTGSTPPCTDS